MKNACSETYQNSIVGATISQPIAGKSMTPIATLLNKGVLLEVVGVEVFGYSSSHAHRHPNLGI